MVNVPLGKNTSQFYIVASRSMAYQSRINILLIGVLSWTTLVAIDTLLKIQKPMCSSGSA